MTKTILIAENSKFIADAYRFKFKKEDLKALIFETLTILNKNWKNTPIFVTSNSEIEKAKKLEAPAYFIKSCSSLADI